MATNNNMVFHRIRHALAEKKKKAIAVVANGNKISDNNPYAEFETKSISELKSFAKINSIDISSLTKKEPIKAKIIEALKARNENVDDGSPVNDNPGGENNDLPVDNNPDSDDSTPLGNINPGSGNQPSEEGDSGNGSDGGTT